MKRFNRSLSVVACAAALAVLPSVAAAVDVAWTATRTSFAQLGEGRTSTKGTAVFKNGDKADTQTTCARGPLDSNGWVPIKCEGEYKFADGSAISMTTEGMYEEKTLNAKSSATFTGGKGRFQGISGKATGTGLQGQMDWTGSYSLPPKK